VTVRSRFTMIVSRPGRASQFLPLEVNALFFL
jgi:hypothetical protein